MTAILGISAFYHDAAAALIIDGRIVAAAQEERFTRIKHDAAFPHHAVRYCLEQANLTTADLDYVGFYEKPLLKFDRLLETYVGVAPSGFRSFLNAMPQWLAHKLHIPREMRSALGGQYRKRFVFTEHHESHAASAFFPSPFEEAAILTFDGVGEWATASYGAGRANRIELSHELRFPHSLGLLYSAFTYYCGFDVNGGEYKLMGLAPYGSPRYAQAIRDHLIDLKPDGSLRLDLAYFNYLTGLTMTSPRFDELFGGPPRGQNEPILQRHMDLAASVQQVTEEVVLCAGRHVHRETGLGDLCLAGGVALNCVANGRLLREGPFRRIWVQPAAGDAGGALGTALFIWHQLLGRPREALSPDAQQASWLGPDFSDDEIAAVLDEGGAVYRRLESDQAVAAETALRIARGDVVGWFQGRMEFGPRALGGRSLVGDARRPGMQSQMNVKVKFRESFRPFAPAVLREQAALFFDVPSDIDSPYMLMVAPVAAAHLYPEPDANVEGFARLTVPRSDIPAVTHVDGSARIQTVDDRHGVYRTMLEQTHAASGCPVVVNTSFNLGWEPIVCGPEDAYRTFMSTDIDALAIGSMIVDKSDQPSNAPRPSGSDACAAHPFCCPDDGGALTAKGERLACLTCNRMFEIADGIPLFIGAPEGARAARAVIPLPASLRDLIDVCRRDALATALHEGLPFNSRLLVVDCGNGALANYLGISCREIIGVDVSSEALRVAEEFRKAHGLSRVRFAQADSERICFEPASFDAVIWIPAGASGVQAQNSVRLLARLLRPGGHIITATSSINRALSLFDRAEVQFVRSIPSVHPGESVGRGALLQQTGRGSWAARTAVGALQIAGRRGVCITVGQVA